MRSCQYCSYVGSLALALTESERAQAIPTASRQRRLGNACTSPAAAEVADGAAAAFCVDNRPANGNARMRHLRRPQRPPSTATASPTPTPTSHIACHHNICASAARWQMPTMGCGPFAGWILGYVVRPGDTLYRIALRYRTSVSIWSRPIARRARSSTPVSDCGCRVPVDFTGACRLFPAIRPLGKPGVRP